MYAPPIGGCCRSDDGARELVEMRWGLVPYWWSKPLKELRLATFNARLDTSLRLRLTLDVRQEHPDSSQARGLLCARPQRPCDRAADESDEFALLRGIKIRGRMWAKTL
jgi:hypothetical protein